MAKMLPTMSFYADPPSRRGTIKPSYVSNSESGTSLGNFKNIFLIYANDLQKMSKKTKKGKNNLNVNK